jgi:colicin import membrane protein
MDTSLTIPADIRTRIIAAAADLFEQSGRQTMPTVDAVRRAARVDMNAASSVMKEWRRAQTAQAAPVAVAVPESVQQASSAAVATIWQQAQELANESLRAAQAAWETERGELDAMRQELAEAFERQAAELDAAGVALAAEKAAAAQQAQELATVRQQLADASSRADKAEARIAEIEHRAADLRGELDRAHADADRLRTENAEARKLATAEIEAAHAAADAARVELVKVQAKAEAAALAHAEQRKQAAAEAHRADERMTKTQAERDDATKAAAEARERAAGLAGQVQAMQEQNAALLAAIKPQGEPKPKKTPPAKA